MGEDGNDSWGKLLVQGRDGVKANDAHPSPPGICQKGHGNGYGFRHIQTKMVKGEHSNHLHFLMREGSVY